MRQKLKVKFDELKLEVENQKCTFGFTLKSKDK